MAQRHLQILVTAKNQAQKQLKGVQGQLEQMEPAFQKMAIGGTAAAGAMGFLGKKSLDAAGNAQEVQGRFNAVFSDTKKETSKWVSDMADEYGRAESTVQAMASNIGGQLGMVAENLPDDEMNKMTKSMSEQSVAMAAYYPNIESAEDASRALSKAMSGSTDRLTEMGYNLEKGKLEQVAMKEGITDTVRELNKEEKALAVQAAMTEQNQKVIASYDENKDSYNEKMRIAREQIKKAAESLGNSLIPMMTELLNKITPVIEKTATWIKENPELVKKLGLAVTAVAGLTAVLGGLGLVLLTVTPAITALTSPIGLVIGAMIAMAGTVTYLWKTNENFREKIMTIWNGLKDFWEEHGKAITSILKSYWEMIKVILTTAFDVITNAVMLFLNVLTGDWKGAWENIKNIFSSVWEGIKGILKNAFEIIKTIFAKFFKGIKESWKSDWRSLGDIFKSVTGYIKKPIDKLVGWIGDKFDWISEKVNAIKEKASGVGSGIGGAVTGAVSRAGSLMPGRALGGPVSSGKSYVVGEKGPELFTPQTSGRIIPNNKLKRNGGGTNINITVNGDVSGEELIEKVKGGIMGELGMNGKFAFD